MCDRSGGDVTNVGKTYLYKHIYDLHRMNLSNRFIRKIEQHDHD